jgi:hypothetical protein
MSVNYTSATEFINICNSKIFTSSRISRILFYLIFNYKKDDYFLFKADDYVYYFRVLGFRKEKDNLLGEIKNSSPIPIITKLSNSIPNLPENARKMLELNLYADEIYRMVSMNKYCSVIPTEQQYGVIIR